MSSAQPFNPEAERALLCAILREPDCLEKAASIIESGDLSQAHSIIFRTALNLFEAEGVVDPGTVVAALSAAGELDKAGGAAYVCSLTDSGGCGANAAAYAETVRKFADARKTREVIKAALAKAGDNGTDPDAAREKLICDLQKIQRISPEPQAHKFEQLAEDRYTLSLPQLEIIFDADRLRREHNELIGELCVRCKLPGVRTYDGVVSVADFNLSSARARSERAKLLTDRSNTKELDWSGYLEELCQRVLGAERAGQPAVDLRELERPTADDAINVDGLVLPRRHPTIEFGDGGAAKSYHGLYTAGRLVQQGLSVAFFDWELAGEDHRDRLERLFGKAMPRISYARCERPLVYEADRLRRIVRDEGIDYALYDSIAFACDGPPEAAEVAGRYFRAVRQIGVGSLHIAHVSKADGADQKPFGSVFWHNGARCTYFVKLADALLDGQTISVGFFNRKANLGRLLPPIGFKIEFTSDRTYFTRENPADTPDLADKMTIRERMVYLLKGGSVTVDDLAKEIDSKPDTIRKTVKRHNRTFVLLEGGKVALSQRVS
ncbi:MAG: hypothetical protein LAP85_27355 [Acidobacteriia bacterium]|nr:hypothetical protein [Terriglobia bacterium]